MAYLNGYAEGTQMLRLLALGHVRAVYDKAHAGEHFRERGHAYPAYAYKVPAHPGLEIILKNLP